MIHNRYDYFLLISINIINDLYNYFFNIDMYNL